MISLEFHPAAVQESEDAFDHYERLRAGLGDDFRVELGAAVARIKQNPKAYAVAIGRFRLCLIHRFPYSVCYQDLPGRIWVAAVAHHSRRYGYWSRRRPSS